MGNGVTWWVRSTIRNSGAMEYITPLQMATESSIVPKSVMNTTVGGPAEAFPASAGFPRQNTHSRISSRKYGLPRLRNSSINIVGPRYRQSTLLNPSRLHIVNAAPGNGKDMDRVGTGGPPGAIVVMGSSALCHRQKNT